MQFALETSLRLTSSILGQMTALFVSGIGDLWVIDEKLGCL